MICEATPVRDPKKVGAYNPLTVGFQYRPLALFKVEDVLVEAKGYEALNTNGKYPLSVDVPLSVTATLVAVPVALR